MKKKKKVLAVITEMELRQVLDIGDQQDAQILMDAISRTLGRIRREKVEWWDRIFKKYNIPKGTNVSINHISREVIKAEPKVDLTKHQA